MNFLDFFTATNASVNQFRYPFLQHGEWQIFPMLLYILTSEIPTLVLIPDAWLKYTFRAETASVDH